MLGNWFRNRLRASGISEGRIAMTRLVNYLEEVKEDREIGPLVAAATVIRVNLENLNVLPRGLLDVERVADLDPRLKAHIKLNSLVHQFEARKQESDAAGTSIVLQSLRAVTFPELRPLGRDLWRQLARGFDHVEAVFKIVEEAKGQPLDPRVREEVRMVPRGLEPEPDEARPA